MTDRPFDAVVNGAPSKKTNGYYAEIPLHLKHQITRAEPATRAVHADEHLNVATDIAPPLHVSTTFRYPRDPELLNPVYDEDLSEYDTRTEHCYSRLSNSNGTRLEAILTSLLKGQAITYSSGLSAIHAFLTFLNPKTISIGSGYHGSDGVVSIHKRLTGCKVVPLECDASELSKGDLIICETPINPTGLCRDIKYYADKAHGVGAYLFVDSTFAPPPLQDPFRWGTDVVMHSGTKYIGGHSDMLCGVLAVNPIHKEGWMPQLFTDRLLLGSVLGSLEGWLGVRSVRTLELRVKRQSASAAEVVDALSGALSGHTVGTGLSESDVAATKAVLAEVLHGSLQVQSLRREEGLWLKKQMPEGHSPVFAIKMKNETLARKLPSKLAYFQHATSLGGVESLIEWRTMSDSTVEKTLLRLSIGVEDPRDLVEDLMQGFRALAEEIGDQS